MSTAMWMLAGATATGKSALIQALAETTGGAILSADAMLVYQGMDIGTAKPTLEERKRVTYYGLDCVTPAEKFSTERWLAEAQRAQTEVTGRPLYVTGGTGLYFSALLRGLDPTPPTNLALRMELETLSLEALQRRFAKTGQTLADLSNPRRLVRALEILESGGTLPTSWRERNRPKLVALHWERTVLHQRIALRVHEMYAQGLLEETRQLQQRYPTASLTAQQAIGYAEAAAVLAGQITQQDAIERTIIRTRQLARRQETYLRGQFDCTWINVTARDSVATLVPQVLEAWQHGE